MKIEQEWFLEEYSPSNGTFIVCYNNGRSSFIAEKVYAKHKPEGYLWRNEYGEIDKPDYFTFFPNPPVKEVTNG